MATQSSYAELFLAKASSTREASKNLLGQYRPNAQGSTGNNLMDRIWEQAHSPWGGLNSFLMLIKDDDHLFGLTRPMYLVPMALEQQAPYHACLLAFNGDIQGDNLPQAYVFPTCLISTSRC